MILKKLQQFQTYLNIYYISLNVWKYSINKRWKKKNMKKIHYLSNHNFKYCLSSHNFKHFKLKKFEEKLYVKFEEMFWKERNGNNKRKWEKEEESGRKNIKKKSERREIKLE